VDIFGSYVRGEQSEKSNIDILATYSESADLLLVARLRRYLRRKLHVKVNEVSNDTELTVHLRKTIPKTETSIPKSSRRNKQKIKQIKLNQNYY